MISELMHWAFASLRSNRSQESWVAGSSVLAAFIDRIPNDIDIHHVSTAAFAEAVIKDTEVLLAAGYSVIFNQESETERERVFANADVSLTINWVLEPKRPVAVINDPLLGVRASYADVIDRKMEMYAEDHQAKHKDDLISLFHKSALLQPEIEPIQFATELSGIGIVLGMQGVGFELFQTLVEELTGYDRLPTDLLTENLTLLQNEAASVGDLGTLAVAYRIFKEDKRASNPDDTFLNWVEGTSLFITACQIVYLFYTGAIRVGSRWKRCGWRQHETALVWRTIGTHAPMTRGTGTYGDWAQQSSTSPVSEFAARGKI
ncbi:hypothetical protein EPK99_23380 [Neorhizobium lilium]|uniref:Nucleotidyl transferase AbiEii toxin, Type IV TA system n=1 Tax=Neorhizobium lilium TaxID=2503024 RepID=A0A3S3RPR2_9HYPH|nr:hypothetical protein [Neorhizobium lilium]RWX74840.1 hypothetical protein EPK99_23380 [Neorhizobium lilium]